jgi:hypothetical protein
MKKLKLIKIVLNLDAMSIASTGKAKIAYEITVFTGDEAEAGLEHGDVYITVCGETKNLSDLKLQRTESTFGRGGRDTFNLELENVEPINMLIAQVKVKLVKFFFRF